ncbi:MAG: hypothetical protein WKF81_09685 [Thermomicrobiales bacterium]
MNHDPLDDQTSGNATPDPRGFLALSLLLAFAVMMGLIVFALILSAT